MLGGVQSIALTTDVNKIHNNNSTFYLCIITECPENLKMILEMWNFLAHGHKSVSKNPVTVVSYFLHMCILRAVKAFWNYSKKSTFNKLLMVLLEKNLQPVEHSATDKCNIVQTYPLLHI